MCGIIGYNGKEEAAPILLNGITRLEYRGYDSVGMVTVTDKFNIKKGVGDVQTVNKEVNFLELPGKAGISHTRWATHGGVTDANAHPHLSYSENVVAVHNGIIENYEEIKKHLKGVAFRSETDSEVIPHYIEHKLREGKSIPEAVKDFISEAEGTFAILFMVEGDENLYAIRRDSPLVLGIGENEFYLGSDIYAFSDRTNKAIFFDDDEWIKISKDDYAFFDKDGNKVDKEVKEFEWDQKEGKIEDYEHFMMKEIREEPEVAERLLLSLGGEQKDCFEKLFSMIKNAKKTVFVGCGTSYHATLLGAYFLHKVGVESQTLIASEFEHFANIDEDSLVIAFTQSGETMDVIDALKYAKRKGAKIASVVNVPYSTIQRMSEISINIQAGQEICVASTKAFINQVIVLLKIAQSFGFNANTKNLGKKIEKIFDNIPKIKEIADEIYEKNDIYVLGRGLSYPVAREMALKIKEISYIHAEGMMGGELKHGTIALIEEGTPVISLVSNNDTAMISNSKEVESRGANVITIGSKIGDVIVDANDDGIFSILASTVGQLLAYYIAYNRELPIDKPRNLAKSVTVK